MEDLIINLYIVGVIVATVFWAFAIPQIFKSLDYVTPEASFFLYMFCLLSTCFWPLLIILIIYSKAKGAEDGN